MSGTDVRTIATTCLTAWTSGDLATARSLLRDDVAFVSPLGTSEGAEEYMAELEALATIVTGAEQRRVMVDGADVCIFYDLVTVPVGPLPTSSWYRVDDGKISSVREYFDARRLAPGGGAPVAAADTDPRVDAGEPLALILPVFCSAEMEIAGWENWH